MSILATLFRVSERIGFASTVVCAIAWLLCGSILTRGAATASFLWQIPMLGLAVEIILSLVVGIGGLVGFWMIAKHVDYNRPKSGCRPRSFCTTKHPKVDHQYAHGHANYQ